MNPIGPILFAPLALAGLSSGATLTESSDAVIEYDRPPPTFGGPVRETMYKHGDRVRIDSGSENRGVKFLHQDYTGPGQQVTFSLTRFEDGGLAYLSLMDDPLTAPPSSAIRRFTGMTETRIGERCRVWEVARTTSYGQLFLQSGCSTTDGIELWRRQANIDAVFARTISRRAVFVGEVRVPVEAMDIAAWLRGPPSADHALDYEVVLEGSDRGLERHIERRSGAWTRKSDEASGGYFSLDVENDAEGIALHYSKSQDGTRRFGIRNVRRIAEPGFSPRVRMQDRPDETIEGEKCQWWNVMPGVMDAGRLDCITAGGIPLKIQRFSRGNSRTLIAVRLRRVPQPLSAVLPDKALTLPAAWGFQPGPNSAGFLKPAAR